MLALCASGHIPHVVMSPHHPLHPPEIHLELQPQEACRLATGTCTAGASEFDDMIVRFKPDGTAHFLILAWDLQTGWAERLYQRVRRFDRVEQTACGSVQDTRQEAPCWITGHLLSASCLSERHPSNATVERLRDLRIPQNIFEVGHASRQACAAAALAALEISWSL